jgi:hypothetical protein
MPFDFDPLSLDFPALTLQCLQPPPTLYSSTQHPTSTSWSVQSPGKREFNALQAYFAEEFRAWKITCASATTATMEELTYPPSTGPYRDVREAVKKAEKLAESLEIQVGEHLQSSFSVWDGLPQQRRNELWILELARSVGRKQKETEKLKDDQHKLKQENANLKTQIEHLNRLQQPREFKLLSPTTIPLEQQLISHVLEQGVKVRGGVGLHLEDRHLDLNTIVAKSIERWKNVITSNRTASIGMNAQKSLEQAATPSANCAPQSPQQQSRSQLPAPPHRQSTTSTNGPLSEAAQSTTGASSDDSSDQDADADADGDVDADADADAEMEDDDSFAVMNTPITKPMPPTQPQATLDVPRTRGPMQRGGGAVSYMMPNGTPNRVAMNMSRSMPNMQAALQAGMHPADLNLAMQSVRGDPMYMD